MYCNHQDQRNLKSSTTMGFNHHGNIKAVSPKTSVTQIGGDPGADRSRTYSLHRFRCQQIQDGLIGWIFPFFEKVGLTLGRWHDVLGLWTCHLPKHHSSCFSHFFWVGDRSTIPSSWLGWWTKYPKEMPKSGFKKNTSFWYKTMMSKMSRCPTSLYMFFWGVLNIKVYGWIEKNKKNIDLVQ